MENRPPRLAVLIDAENASHRIAAKLFEEIAGLGDATVRRIYGDFSSENIRGWVGVLAAHAVTPRQNFANIKGKNATDIALVIDAMDLLHSGRLEGFCLVSSDSDFTELAKRIREHGINVYGFGEQKTPESFRQACHRFIFTEHLGMEASPETLVDPEDSNLAITNAKQLIMTAIDQIDNEGEWVPLSAVGSRLHALRSDFDHRNYGFKQLSALITATGTAELRRTESGHFQVRLKQT